MEVALGVGSLVLLAGGVTAVVRRAIRPSQAVGVLAIAATVAAIAVLADWLAEGRSLGGVYQFAVVAPTTLAGMAMAVSLVVQRQRRIP
jgi:hypothetical protein